MTGRKSRLGKKKAEKILDKLDIIRGDFLSDDSALSIAESAIGRAKCILNEKDWKEYFDDAVAYARNAEDFSDLRMSGIIQDLISTKNPDAIEFAVNLSEEMLRRPEDENREYYIDVCIYALIAGGKIDRAKEELSDTKLSNSVVEDLILYLIEEKGTGYARKFAEEYIKDGYEKFLKVCARQLAEKGSIGESLDYAGKLFKEDRVYLWLDIFRHIYHRSPVLAHEILEESLRIASDYKINIWIRIVETLLEVDEILTAYSYIRNLDKRWYYNALTELYYYLKLKDFEGADDIFNEITEAYRVGKVSKENYFPVNFFKETLDGTISYDFFRDNLDDDIMLDSLHRIFYKLCRAGKFDEALYSLDIMADDTTGYVWDDDVAYLIDIVAEVLVEKIRLNRNFSINKSIK